MPSRQPKIAFNPIIESLLDTDLYKFTMQQLVLHHFPGVEVEYEFKCRTKGVDLAPLIGEIQEQINHLCTLGFTEEELGYLRGLRFIKPSYTGFLEDFKLNPKHVSVEADPSDPCGISIHIKGSWFHTILFEVPILAIVNEAYFRASAPHPDYKAGLEKVEAKIKMGLSADTPETFKYSDFGTRRRFSRHWQERVVVALKNGAPSQFTGTSNVLLAKKHGLTPIGTMAHEYLQACQALGPNLRSFQTFAFEKWAQEYRGDLGIALSDVVGIDPFLKDFDLYFCKLFDGARHDSGDPFVWGEKMIAHYQKNRIDPRTKNLVFSDGLDFPKAIELHKAFGERSNPVFGIGTNLTNDLGFKPLNVVIKMTRCSGHPVAKISDSPGKAMCKEAWFLRALAHEFNIPLSKVEAMEDEVGLASPSPRASGPKL